jgi:hypothetical protein
MFVVWLKQKCVSLGRHGLTVDQCRRLSGEGGLRCEAMFVASGSPEVRWKMGVTLWV